MSQRDQDHVFPLCKSYPKTQKAAPSGNHRLGPSAYLDECSGVVKSDKIVPQVA
jgi:hypothetical protein